MSGKQFFFFSTSVSHTIFGKFKFNWASYILSGKSIEEGMKSGHVLDMFEGINHSMC